MQKGAKKKQIIRAATQIFARKGFHQAKMDEIAKAAKGTLYYNYASKSKLFAATVTAGMEEIMDKISRELESDLPFMEHFRLLLSHTIRIYLKNKEVIRIYVNELSSGIDAEALAEKGAPALSPLCYRYPSGRTGEGVSQTPAPPDFRHGPGGHGGRPLQQSVGAGRELRLR